MIYDLMTSGAPAGQGHYDHCVIGSGPAGMTLAMTLAAKNQRVILLEAGGREFTDRSQILYEGEVLGLDTHALDVPRLRYLGGTSGHWTGRVLHRRPSDFEPREDIPLSGWPIRDPDLAPYRTRAANMLGVPTFGQTHRAADDSGTIDIVTQHFSSDDKIYTLRKDQPRRFGTRFERDLDISTTLDTLLNANVTELVVDTATGRITRALIQDYADRRYEITADTFTMAMGGIENARALLHLNEAHHNRFGNQGDMVGRCFMDHPRLPLGAYFISQRMFSPLRYFGAERLVRRAPQQMVLSPAADHNQKNGSLSGGVWLNFPKREPLPPEALTAPFLRSLTFGKDYFFIGESNLFAEQAPNPASRLILSNARDRFGLRQAALDWQLLPVDVQTMRHTALEAAQFLIRNGLGRMQIEPTLWRDDDPSRIPMMSSSHHMGGARMGTSTETSVVDLNCRVHGARNLYVAGSSVFPTSGFVNPTYTIVQLALRLADHLVEQRT